jgi:hypothetical protein
LLLLALPGAVGAAEESKPAASQPAPLDPDTMDMVKAFLKMPTEQLPVEHIPKFLAVDPEALPANLRQRFVAKKVELYTLKQLADGRKRGAVRMPEENCAAPKDSKSSMIGILHMAGYVDITEDEEKFVEDHTHCTENDLMCEFTLQIVVERVGKKKEPRRTLLLHVKDPLMTLVGQYRDQGREKQTNFFGMMGVSCAPRLK